MRVMPKISGRARAIRLPAGGPADWLVLAERSETMICLSDAAFQAAFQPLDAGPAGPAARRTPLRGRGRKETERRPAPETLPVPGTIRAKLLGALMAAPSSGLTAEAIANNIGKPRVSVSSVISTLYHGGVLLADHQPQRGHTHSAARYRLSETGRQQGRALLAARR